MLTRVFLPHSVNVNTGAGVSGWINQVDSANPDLGVTLFEETAGSQTDREFVAERNAAPVVAISTSDLTFLSTCGMLGLPVTADIAKPGITVYARELLSGSVPTAIATADHLTMVVSDGLLVPTGVRAGHNTVARLSLMLHSILGAGVSSQVAPMIVNSAQTIATGAGQIANVFCAGPVKYTISGGSSRLVEISDLSVNFGLQVIKEGDSSSPYPTRVCIIARNPKIEFSTEDIELASEVGEFLSVSAFAGYFRKLSANGSRVAAGTASHVGMAGIAGVITPGAVGLRHKQSGAAAFTYTPVLSSTTLMTITVGIAIPTS